MANNKYWDKAKEVECKYNGVLKQLMNNCRKEVIEAGEIYNEKAVVKKQQEIVAKYIKEINRVQEAYINDMEKMIEHEALMIRAMQDDKPKDNVTRLIEAMELNNKIALNNIKFATMSDEQLYKLAQNNQSELECDMIRAELYKRAEGKENVAELKLRANMVQPVTEQSMLNEVAQQVRLDKANQSELLIGMELNEKLHVNKKGNIKAFLSQDIQLNMNDVQQ